MSAANNRANALINTLVSMGVIAGLLLSFLPLQAYEHFFFAASVITLGSTFCLALMLQQFSIPPEFRFIGWNLLGVWLCGVMSVIASEVPFISFIYLMALSTLPLSFLLGMTIWQNSGKISWLLSPLSVIFAALAVFTWIQYFFLPDWLFQGRRVHWPLADPNTLAGCLSLGFWGALGIMLHAPKPWQRSAGLILCVLLMGSLLASGSRGLLVCLGLVVCAYAWPLRNFLYQLRKCAAILTGSGLFFVYFFVQQDASSVNGFLEMLHHPVQALSDRPAIWAATLSMIAKHPLTGTGIGTFFLYYPEFRAGDFDSAGLMAHHDPLQFAAEMGVFAPVFLYVIFFYMNFGTLRAAPDQKRYLFLPTAAFSTIFIHAHLTHNFYTLPTLVLLGVCLAIFCALKERVVPLRVQQFSYSSYISRYSLAATLFMSVAAFTFAISSEILTARAEKRLRAGDISQFINDINLAGKLSFNLNPRTLLQAAMIPKGLYSALPSDSVHAAQREKSRQRALDLLKQAQRMNPRLPEIYVAQAQLNDSDLIKIDLLQTALRINPRHIPARLLLADMYESHNDLVKALAILSAGLDWPYTGPESEHYLARTAALATALKQPEITQKSLQKMLDNRPHAEK